MIVQKKADINYVAGFSGDVPKTHAAIEKAQELLNYMPQTSVRCGLERMYEWYKNEYLSIVAYK